MCQNSAIMHTWMTEKQKHVWLLGNREEARCEAERHRRAAEGKGVVSFMQRGFCHSYFALLIFQIALKLLSSHPITSN